MEWTKFNVINIILVIIYIIIATGLFNSPNSAFVYDFKEQVKFNEVIATADNNLLVVGAVAGDSYEQGMDAFVAKITHTGETIWSHSFGGAGDDQFYNIASTSDGYVLVGTDAEDVDLSTDAYLVKIDHKGEKKWENSFNNQFNSQFNDVKVTANGDLVCVGELEFINSEQNLNTNAYVIKTDKEGQELWSKKFGGRKFTSGQAIADTNDENYFIAGYTNNESGQQAWLLNLTVDGEEKWAKEYFSAGSSSFYDLEQLSTGELIAAGEANNDSNCGYLVKLKKDGEIIWDKIIKESENSYSVFYTVTELSPEQIIVGGVNSVPDSFGNLSSIRYENLLYALDVNSQGEKIAKKKFFKERMGTLMGSAKIDNEEVVLVGDLNQYEVDYRGYLTIFSK